MSDIDTINQALVSGSQPSATGLSTDQINAILEQNQKDQDDKTKQLQSQPSAVMYKDGSPYTVEGKDIQRALSMGYTPETHTDLLRRDEQFKNEQAGIFGSLKEGTKSFINQTLMGVPDILMNSGESEDEKVRREQREEDYKLARTVGGVGGFGASLAVGGPLFKGAGIAGEAVERGVTSLLERAGTEGAEQVGQQLATKAAEGFAQKSITTRILGSMANQATQGAIISSPQALAQAIVGDPDKSAETLSWGLGLGTFFGGAGELVSSATKAAETAAKDGATNLLDNQNVKDKLNDFANGTALKLAGFSKPILNKMSPSRIADTANLLFESGAINSAEGKTAIGDMAEVLHQKIGKEIGNIRSELDDVITAPVMGTTQRVSKASIPSTVKDAAPTRDGLIAYLTEELNHPELRFEHNKPLLEAKDMFIRDAAKLGDDTGNLTFRDLQNFQEDLRGNWTKNIQRYFKDSGVSGINTITPADAMKGNAYMAVRNYTDAAANKVVEAANDAQIPISTALVQRLAKARRDYSIILDIENAQADLAKREIANRSVGLTDMLHAGHGPASFATGATLGAIGHAVGGPVAGFIGYKAGRLLGAPLDIMVKHWAEDKGLAITANLARKAAKDGAQVFSGVITQEAKDRLANTLSQVQTILQRTAQRSSPLTANTTLNPISHLLGSSNLSTEKQKESVLAKLNNFAANPQAVPELTQHFTGALSQFSQPLADAYHNQVTKQINYLTSNAPQKPQPIPFAPKQPDISPTAWKSFMDKAEVAINPFSVMHHFEKGTLTDDHLDALNNVWQNTKDDIVSEIAKTYADNPDLVIPTQKRALLAKITGMDLGTSGDYSDVQQVWQTLNPDGKSQDTGGDGVKAKIDSSNFGQPLQYSQMASGNTNEKA